MQTTVRENVMGMRVSINILLQKIPPSAKHCVDTVGNKVKAAEVVSLAEEIHKQTKVAAHAGMWKEVCCCGCMDFPGLTKLH